MAVNLSRLKSTQYLLICRAGLEVSAESEAASEELKRDMLQEFKAAVEKFSMFDDLEGYPTDILMRSKNFIARMELKVYPCSQVFRRISYFPLLFPQVFQTLDMVPGISF